MYELTIDDFIRNKQATIIKTFLYFIRKKYPFFDVADVTLMIENHNHPFYEIIIDFGICYRNCLKILLTVINPKIHIYKNIVANIIQFIKKTPSKFVSNNLRQRFCYNVPFSIIR